MNYSWLIDQRKCIGCHACSTACKSENEVPLSVDRTWVKYVEKGTFPNAQRHFGVLRCNHCAKPPCVDICPVTAMFQRKDGIVEFNSDACIGCKACIAACPYDAIYIDPENGTAAKCNFCSHRLDVGLEPACVTVCPEEALVFGDLDDPNSKISQLVGREKTQVRKPEKNTDPKCFYIGADEAVLNPDVQTHDDSGLYMWSNQKCGSHGAQLDNNVFVPITKSSDNGSGLSLSDALNTVTGAKVAYDVPHHAPWGADVSLYLWTKSISAGVVLVAWFVWTLAVSGNVSFGLPASSLEPYAITDAIVLAAKSPDWLFWMAPVLGTLFLALTGVFLVKDLDRPERFLTILTRPQFKSWLAIGAYIILAYSIVLVLDIVAYVWGYATKQMGLFELCFSLSMPLAAMTAIYTAFLFAQAKGRDLWQSPLLPINLLLQALTAGAGTFLILTPLYGGAPELYSIFSWTLIASTLLQLSIVLMGEVLIDHASKAQERAVKLMVKGPYKFDFWISYAFGGVLVPAALLASQNLNMFLNLEVVYPLSGILALIGLFAYENAFVMAGQSVRLS